VSLGEVGLFSIILVEAMIDDVLNFFDLHWVEFILCWDVYIPK